MKKYLIITLSLLLLWILEFFWMGRYSQRLSFEELTALPEISEGIELKRESYWCRIADRYDFSIIPHLPIQIPSNQKSVQTGDFFAYPLAELSRDLFVDKIIQSMKGRLESWSRENFKIRPVDSIVIRLKTTKEARFWTFYLH